jgi:hypothetical protein
MNKTRILSLIACFSGAITSIAALFMLSAVNKHSKNGFIRLLPPHFAEPVIHTDIRYNSFYIAGLTSKDIYLGNYTNPYRLLRIGNNLKDTQTFVTDWSGCKIHKGALVSVDSSYVYLKDGNGSVILQANFNDLNKISIVNTPPFTASLNFGANSFVLRCVTKEKNNVLVRQKFRDKQLEKNANLLQKQGDGIFSTDGMLVRIPSSSKFVYVYYYRNQFFYADSQLKLVYRAKTLDTVSHVHIKVAPIKSLKEITMSAPPLLVNRKCCASDEYLFVNSALNANNEDWQVLKVMSIIDVYELKNGKYKVSFYLPNFGGKKLSDFKVCGNTLVAIYDHYIMTYRLNFKYLNL